MYIISEKIVHPKSKNRFSTESIQQALKKVNFNVLYNKDAKIQALKAIKRLEKYFYIERSRRLIKLHLKNPEILKVLKLNFEF